MSDVNKSIEEFKIRAEQRQAEDIIERMKYPQMDPDLLKINSKEDLVDYLLGFWYISQQRNIENYSLDAYEEVHKLELEVEKEKLMELADRFFYGED